MKREFPAGRLILTGLMGSGKSTTGKALAALSGKRFIDTDREVVAARGGVSIADQFLAYGEAAFRALEAAVVSRILGAGDSEQVIALGGGAILDLINRRRIRQAGIVVWLDTDVRLIAQRLDTTGQTRPLLPQQPVVMLRRYHRRRAPVYRTADLTVGVTRDAIRIGDGQYPHSSPADLVSALSRALRAFC